MKRFAILILTVLMFSAAAFADEAVPPTPKRTPKPSAPIDTTLQVRISPDAKEARLIIPKSQLKQLRAELDGLEGDDSNYAAMTRVQTIAGGFFLSLALAFGGVWLARSGKPGKPFAAGAVIFLASFGATLVYANAGPPQEARSITGKIFSQPVHVYKAAYGKIKLETSDSGNSVELIVPDVKDAKPGE